MFGYVRPSLGKLSEEDKARFGAAYCGLCRTLGERYGQAARMILNYDLTFLAILLWPEEVPAAAHGGCAAHPFSGRAYYPGNPALELAADESVILSWWQIRDALADPGGGKGKYRAASLALKGAYGRAAERRPDLDRITREKLEQLRELEEARCPSLDRPADAFAGLLAAAAAGAPDPVKRRVLEQMLYHLGRWIYLADARDDLEEDKLSGRYNPVAARYGPRGDDGALRLTMDNSLARIGAALQLGDFGCRTALLENIVYLGLPAVERAVFDGTWKEIKKQKIWRNDT